MLLDIAIVVFGIISLFRGRDVGFVRQLFSTIGFFGGLFIGALLEPRTIALVHTATARGVVTVITTLGSALILLSIGEYVGLRLKHKVLLIKLINSYDNALGAVLSVFSLLLSIWLSASVASSLPYPAVQTVVQDSAIIKLLNQRLPSAPSVIADLGHLVDPNGFPQVFIGSEPIPRGNVNLPSLGQMQTAVNKDKDSIVKISGQGCGGIVEGSGFVAGAGTVVTNAHVVAGIKHPYVQDTAGSHSATVVWFDPNLDIAIIRVSNLAGAPLTIVSQAAKKGSAAAVVGYPGGGPFTASAAAVLDNFTATGRNIYGSGSTSRDVYELQAKVIPGNSGGPLIDQAGNVIGVIFAESTSYKNVGYALTTPAVITALNQAINRTTALNTGKCAD